MTKAGRHTKERNDGYIYVIRLAVNDPPALRALSRFPADVGSSDQTTTGV